eukprot:g43202.t1
MQAPYVLGHSDGTVLAVGVGPEGSRRGETILSQYSGRCQLPLNFAVRGSFRGFTRLVTRGHWPPTVTMAHDTIAEPLTDADLRFNSTHAVIWVIMSPWKEAAYLERSRRVFIDESLK